ncbi:HigA family addiction module antitoxin [Neptuniibacter sp.]|uniref:HigA family addiction module antitoxin n=1 Tax=Neptuniibacter sp. TaxID=1962643 RepID=UPI00261124B1|nr:HigA family addiction module antitoxin [Neptuniibacter sp.]
MKILNGPPSVGDMINELYLIPTGISAKEAAELCQIEFDLFQKILSGAEPIGYELAYKLSKGFNTTHNFWLNIQKDYQDSLDKVL